MPERDTRWARTVGRFLTLHILIYSHNIPMYSHILTVLLADCWRFAHSMGWDLSIWVNVNCVVTLDAVWIPSFIIIALPTILVYILQSLCISSSAVQEKKQSYHRLNKSLVAQRSCCCYCLGSFMFVTTSCFVTVRNAHWQYDTIFLSPQQRSTWLTIFMSVPTPPLDAVGLAVLLAMHTAWSREQAPMRPDRSLLSIRTKIVIVRPIGSSGGGRLL